MNPFFNLVLIFLVRGQDHEEPLKVLRGEDGEPGEPGGFTLPLDEDYVHWHCGQDHRQPDPGLHGLCDHWEESDDQGHCEVDEGEGQVNLDGPGEVRLGPTEVGEAEHGGPDREPSREPQVVHQHADVTEIFFLNIILV